MQSRPKTSQRVMIFGDCLQRKPLKTKLVADVLVQAAGSEVLFVGRLRTTNFDTKQFQIDCFAKGEVEDGLPLRD